MIVRVLVSILMFPNGPFWEALPPGEWTGGQIAALLAESPWVSSQEGAHIFLASAKPIREAEIERWTRRQPEDELAAQEYTESSEYIEFIRDNADDYIVLAVHIPYPQYLLSPKDTKAMENRCFLVTGGKRHKLVGHFPPTPGDRYLRLVFPRLIDPSTREFHFRLYVPGVPNPYRRVEFLTENLTYHGHPEW